MGYIVYHDLYGRMTMGYIVYHDLYGLDDYGVYCVS